jgi:antitoxin component HigA of HigAB toxin-antitoxin module
VKPQDLQTEAEYKAALAEVWSLFDAPANTPEAGAVVIPLRA